MFIVFLIVHTTGALAAPLSISVGSGIYDDTDPAWVYSGTWNAFTGSSPYNNTDHNTIDLTATACRRGTAPEACLVIDDTTADIRADKAAGAQTVAVLCGFGEEDGLRGGNPDLMLLSTAELGKVLIESKTGWGI